MREKGSALLSAQLGAFNPFLCRLAGAPGASQPCLPAGPGRREIPGQRRNPGSVRRRGAGGVGLFSRRVPAGSETSPVACEDE